MEVFTSLFSWPFQGQGAAVSIIKNKLPPDARFLGIKSISGKDIYVIVGSDTWVGEEHNLLLPDPVFAIHGEYANKPKPVTIEDLEIVRWSANKNG